MRTRPGRPAASRMLFTASQFGCMLTSPFHWGYGVQEPSKQKDLVRRPGPLCCELLIYPTTSFSAPASSAASAALSSTTSRPPPSSGTRMTIPRPSLVTSIGPSPVRGFIAAIAHPLCDPACSGAIIPYRAGLGEPGDEHATVDKVIVDQPDRLHRRVRRGGSKEPDPSLLQLSGQRNRSRRSRRHVGQRARASMVRFVVAPDQLGKALTPSGDDPRVGDGSVDLGQITDDAGIAQKSVHIGFVVQGHPLRQKLVERSAEVLTLAQDRDPRQPGLERLERHPLVQARDTGNWLAPLSIVIVQVLRR